MGRAEFQLRGDYLNRFEALQSKGAGLSKKRFKTEMVLSQLNHRRSLLWAKGPKLGNSYVYANAKITPLDAARIGYGLRHVGGGCPCG
jgi:hypothetical protein